MLQEIEILHLFNEKVDRIDRSGLARRYAEETPRVMMKFERPIFGKGEEPDVFTIEGRIESRLEDFNEDEIDAFVLSFRLLTQENDRLSIRSLARIYESDWMPAEAKAAFVDARTKLNAYLESPASIVFGEYQITVKALADTVIYGGLAHSNPAKSGIFRSWMKSGFAGFIWAEFLAYTREMTDYFRYFRSLNAAVIENIRID